MECWFLCRATENCNWFTFDKDEEYKHKNYGICWLFYNCPKIFPDPNGKIQANHDIRSVTGHRGCKYDWGKY